MAVSGEEGRPPARPGTVRAGGSSGEGRLNAPSQFGIKKDIPIPHIAHQVRRNISMGLFYGVKAIIIIIFCWQNTALQISCGVSTVADGYYESDR
jgi:hypothetical protein